MNELESFAILCNNTKRASFTITRNVKTLKWRVTIASRKHFINESLTNALNEASKYVYNQRKFVNGTWFEIPYQ